MSTFQIKILAILTMVIDHVGLFFFPQHHILRIIGRISFPLFAWMIANGAYHTNNIEQYLQRLFLLALLSQIPFTLANQIIGSPLFYLNVVFTLFLGLLAIYLIKKTNSAFLWILTTLSCGILANIIHSDYGAAGVFSVVAFYIFYKNKPMTILTQTILLFIIPAGILLAEMSQRINLSTYYMDSSSEKIGLFALLPILLYNNKEGPKMKQLFYIFYPLQYILIYLMLLHSI